MPMPPPRRPHRCAALLIGLALGAAGPGAEPAEVATPAVHHAGKSRAGVAKAKMAAKADKARPPERAARPYGRRAAAMRLAAEIAAAHGLDRAWVESALADARLLPEVRRLIMPLPLGTAKDWAAYRERFVEPGRIAAGLAFWEANLTWLEAAQARWGVAPEVVVGIVGVETFYGRLTGRFRVLDALATLSLDFPSGRSDRSGYFRDELAQLLLLARREAIAPGALRGSYAGAIGLGQFMPSSINRLAVDFDGNGQIDMVGSPADVIGSIAHYLADAGWVAGMPSHFAVQPPAPGSAGLAALLAPDIVPSFSAQQFAEQGATLGADGQGFAGLLALVELQNGGAAPSHVAGTANFYAVTRYNRSAYYALGVIELGQAVAARRQLAQPATPPLPAQPAASQP